MTLITKNILKTILIFSQVVHGTKELRMSAQIYCKPINLVFQFVNDQHAVYGGYLASETLLFILLCVYVLQRATQK